MSIFTTFLNLLKKDPATDGEEMFNIQTMLNENWDKIDAAIGLKAGNADVRVASTSNIVLSGLQSVDGVVLQAGDRVLVAGQTAGEQNGIYVAASGAWARAADADTSAKLASGLSVYVREGTVNAKTEWRLSSTGVAIVGTTPLGFTLMSGAGSVGSAQIAAKAITQAKIADKAVGSGQIADGAVGATQITPGAVTDTVIGNRIVDDTIAAASGSDTPTRLLGKLANMMKGITGKSNWYTAPRTTLENAVRLNGDTMTGPLKVSTTARELIVGTWGDVSTNSTGYTLFANNAYAGDPDNYYFSNDHATMGARGIRLRAGSNGIEYFDTGSMETTAGTEFTPVWTSLTPSAEAAANRLILRDASGRGKVAAPAASDDIARKDTVDAVQSNLATHIGTGGAAHAVATQTAAGFASASDKTKLDGIAAGANNYVHPSGDGNLHVPATSTSSNGKVLKAGSTAGSAAWGSVAFSEIASKPTTLAGYGITDVISTRLNNGMLEVYDGMGWIPVNGNFTYAQSNNIQYIDTVQRSFTPVQAGTGSNYLVYTWTPSYDGFINVQADLTITNGQVASLVAGSMIWGRQTFGNLAGMPLMSTYSEDSQQPQVNLFSPVGTLISSFNGSIYTYTVPGSAGSVVSGTASATAVGMLAVFAGVTIYFFLHGVANSGQNGPATIKNFQIKYTKVASG
ncbi:hypothetical protein [Paenibacillus glycinis]|uniref:Uncharacterized protein n=1 Tax=Paenibacillus glycinis TaxID=2697035 RepID=A0ABW9XNV3_9BACL|nr:hypothetical protein [Paenibacillus glycinis]NBD24313.1 hypothetical protein [Paenibacillus glycinis]